MSLVAGFAWSCSAPMKKSQESAKEKPTATIPASRTPNTPTAAPTNKAITPTAFPTGTSRASSGENTRLYTYRIVRSFPHDRNAFTEGLVFKDGWLLEGTGLHGRSTLRRVTLETGQVTRVYALPEQYFGEGVTLLDDRIIQLTWKSHVGFVYDNDTFELLRVFHYPTEGWGITHDGSRLVMSDGTLTLYFLDPETLENTGRLVVHDSHGPASRSSLPDRCFPSGERTAVSVYGEPAIGFNELEYIHGEVFANVWKTDCIARIDLQSGRVTGWVILSGLLDADESAGPIDVLNGIAYDDENDRLFVTGKLWPKLFEIELIETGETG